MANIMRLIALKAIEMINDNIREGVSYEGEQYEYSTKPFAMPYSRKAAKGLGKPVSKKNPEGLYSVFRSKKEGGSKWMLILGGYKLYKEKVNPEAKNDYLVFSGKMLRNLKILDADDETMKAQIGFTDPEQSKKAFWFNVSGIGKGRKLWKFLGLTEQQQLELGDYAAGIITKGDLAKLLNLPPEIS